MKKVKSIRYGCALVCSCLAIVFLFSVVQAEDVTDSIQVNESGAFYNRRTGDYSYDVVLENISSSSFQSPITAVITNLSSADVTVSNADGTDSSGNPYFDYSADLLGDDNILTAGELSGARKWIFHNPTRIRFTYDVQIMAGYGPADNLPPSISITNPVNNSVTTTTTPYITIQFADKNSDINLSSLAIQINGTDSASLFSVTNTRATYQTTSPLPSGNNVISAFIRDNAGNTSTVVSDFTIGSRTEPNLYIFSVSNNDWIFASPGDGTCTQYLSREDLGVLSFSDVVALSKVTPDGNLFFTLSGHGGILQSPADGTNSVLYNNTQLGLESGDQVVSGHIGLSGTGYFSIEGQPNIVQSSGNYTNSSFMENYLLGLENTDLINCLHIGYDNTIYFCGPDGQIVSQSTGGSTNTQFLTATELGVPGSTIDGFAILPEAVPPEITITNPMDGAFLNTTTPNITVTFQDSDSGIDTTTFYAEINGANMTSAFSVSGTGATYQVPDASPLPVGDNTMLARIRDRVGNEASTTSDFSLGIFRAIPGASPTSGTAPLTVHFTTDGEDPAGTIQRFRWDFDGNGSYDTYDEMAKDYNHTYNSSGTYNATLYVWSSTGESASASITITVENNPPVATADVVPSNGAIPLNVDLYGSGSDSDGSIVLYEWDFDGDGVYEWSSATTGTTTYSYNVVGTYNAVFRVTDNEGDTSTAVAVTTVISAGPEGSPTAEGSATPDSGPAPLTVSFDGMGIDPDGTIVLYEWDYENDGVYDWSSSTTAATNHTYNDAGSVTAAFRVTDNDGKTGVDYLLIEVGLQVSLQIFDSDQTFNPYSGESIGINASINAPVPAFVDIKNEDGVVIKSLQVDTTNIPVPLFSDNMENGAGGWTHGGSNDRWQLGSPTTGPGSARSGNNCWATNLSGNYSNYMNCWLLTPSIQITEACELTFYHYFYSESDYDRGYVEITTNGTSFSQLSGGYYTGSLEGWSKQTFNLSNYVGQTVQIRFRFYSDSSVIRPGWYIDDVRIETATGDVIWDGTDNNNLPATDGVYYAVLRYQYQGVWHSLDLTDSTGGSRYSDFRADTGGSENNPKTFSPFEDDFLPINFTLNNAAEVTLFVGYLWGQDTRIRTLTNRVPFQAGTHTVYWDGLDDNEQLATAPPGWFLIPGAWAYTLPDNAMYMTGGSPQITDIAAEPNYFSPFSEKCDENGMDEGIILTYNVSENVAQVEYRVYSLETGALLRTDVKNNIPSGENTYFWDGKNNDGEYVDIGDYQIGIIATDGDGNDSMLRYSLIRVDY